MKMAKATEADLDMAAKLTAAFDALEDGYFPVGLRPDDDDIGRFDADDPDECKEVMEYLLGLVREASLMRVVLGAAVMLDARNKCVDASADTLEHHPYVQRYEWLRARALDTIEKGGVFAGRTPDNVVLNGDDLDAAIDAAMADAMPAND